MTFMVRSAFLCTVKFVLPRVITTGKLNGSHTVTDISPHKKQPVVRTIVKFRNPNLFSYIFVIVFLRIWVNSLLDSGRWKVSLDAHPESCKSFIKYRYVPSNSSKI